MRRRGISEAGFKRLARAFSASSNVANWASSDGIGRVYELMDLVDDLEDNFIAPIRINAEEGNTEVMNSLLMKLFERFSKIENAAKEASISVPDWE